jgi:hypothetical protein
MMTPASSRFGLELIEQHPSARNHARHDRTLHHHVEAALHRAGRERRAGAKIMPAVRKALEKLVAPSGSATSIARAYLRDVPPVPMNAAFGFARGYILRQS